MFRFSQRRIRFGFLSVCLISSAILSEQAAAEWDEPPGYYSVAANWDSGATRNRDHVWPQSRQPGIVPSMHTFFERVVNGPFVVGHMPIPVEHMMAKIS